VRRLDVAFPLRQLCVSHDSCGRNGSADSHQPPVAADRNVHRQQQIGHGVSEDAIAHTSRPHHQPRHQRKPDGGRDQLAATGKGSGVVFGEPAFHVANRCPKTTPDPVASPWKATSIGKKLLAGCLSDQDQNPAEVVDVPSERG